jgi:hypothetical protein
MTSAYFVITDFEETSFSVEVEPLMENNEEEGLLKY